MRTLLILNEELEGISKLEYYMRYRGDDVYAARLYEGEDLPDYLEYFDALIVMDGEMNVYEEDIFPFLPEEISCLEQALHLDLPILGFSLGAQLIARACGAVVKKAPEREIGFRDVSLTYLGLRDPIFRGLPLVMPVLEWHEDTFEIPHGGRLLAFSHACPNQAFRVGRAYGLQFLVDVNSDMLIDWFEDLKTRKEIMGRFRKIEKDLAYEVQLIYSNFAALVS